MWDAIHSALRTSSAALRGPLLVAMAYYVAAQSAFLIGTLSDNIFAPFWPPNVVLFCALLLTSRSRWLLYLLVAFPAHVLAELSVGMPAPQLVVAFATNCVVAILNAVMFRQLAGGPPWLGDFRKACLYIVLTAGVGPAVAAFGGAFVPITGGGSFGQYWTFWAHWYVANALASLTLGPIVLAWAGDRQALLAAVPTARWLEAIALGLVIVVVCMLALHAARTAPSAFLPALLYMPLPFILWATMRFGARGASATILILTVVLISYTLRGPSPFAGGDAESTVLALQLFLTGLSAPIILLGSLADQLRQSESATRALAASVLKTQDEERRRVARELHDSTAQNLVAATLLVGNIKQSLPPSADPVVGQLLDTLERSTVNLRTMSHLLHPPLLDEAGLPLALRTYVQGLANRSEMHVSLEVSDAFDRLPGEVELTLFRVTQEALSSMKRHLSLNKASIRLSQEPHSTGAKVVLSVADVPSGVSGAPAPRRYTRDLLGDIGFAHMRERLRHIGGEVQLSSATGRVVLSAVVPIFRPSDRA